MVSYLPRLVDKQFDDALKLLGAVVLEGPKACGKTSTASQRAASTVRLDTLEPGALALARSHPRALLDGDQPRLVDEWQIVPDVWNQVRAAVDDDPSPGRFILTGSATPADDLTRHTGTGRFLRLRMHPMSLFESGDSDGTLTLAALLAGDEITPVLGNGATLDDVARMLCRGGFPRYVSAPASGVAALVRSHLDSIVRADIVTVDGVRRDPRRVERLVFSLARNSASYVTKKTMAADLDHAGGASPKTVTSYLDALERLWIAVPQPAWGERLRSAAQVRRSPKWHLADPSLAVAALGATPATLLAEPGAFGQLFESMVFRDLSVYAQANGAKVFSYLDSDDREIDAVVEKDGQWAAFEVKLATAPEVVDRAAASLVQVTAGMRRPPKSLNVVVPSGASYRRPDGVNVVALTSLTA